MKVLRIEHNSFSKTLNNGKTAEDLFSLIPKEDRFQIYFTPIGDLDDLDYASSSFLISDSDVINAVFKRSNSCGGVNRNHEQKSSLVMSSNKKEWYKKRLFRDFLWKSRAWKTKELLSWCKEINPDIIVLGGSSQTFPFEIAEYLSKELNIPTALYCGDDYIAYVQYSSLWDKIQKVRLRRIYKHFCKRSSVCMAISQLMSDKFSELLRKKFVTIPRPIDIPQIVEKPLDGLPVVSYFGGLHLNRWKMIARLAKMTKNAEFRVYSMADMTKEIEEAFLSCKIRFMGGVSGERLTAAIHESDILLHVESDDKYMSSFTRLAMSTKIPEYLSAKRIVLGYGPSDLASMRILSDNDIGVVLDSQLPEYEIKKKIERIINDQSYRLAYAEKGYQFAKDKYPKELVAKQFTELLQSVVVNN